jgi:hypothetical protein
VPGAYDPRPRLTYLRVDIALTEDADGRILVHRADCPWARFLANAGFPVVTMFDCQRMPPADMKRHSCLEPEDTNGDHSSSAH